MGGYLLVLIAYLGMAEAYSWEDISVSTSLVKG